MYRFKPILFIICIFPTFSQACNWQVTQVPSQTQQQYAQLNALTYANNRFVAVGEKVTASSDDGKNWQYQRLPDMDLAQVIWADNAFWASGVWYSGEKVLFNGRGFLKRFPTLLRSVDGVNWDAEALPAQLETSIPLVSSGKYLLGRVADTTNQLLWRDEQGQWHILTLDALERFSHLDWDGERFVLFGRRANEASASTSITPHNNIVAYSDTGRDWQFQPLNIVSHADYPDITSFLITDFFALSPQNYRAEFFIKDAFVSAESEEGSQWTLKPDLIIPDVQFSDGFYKIKPAENAEPTEQQTVLYSTDAQQWQKLNLPSTAKQIQTGENTQVLLTYRSQDQVYWSHDLEQWQAANLNYPRYSELEQLVSNGQQLVAMSATEIFSLDEEKQWQSRLLNTEAEFKALLWTEGAFLAIGEQQQWRSVDGVDWQVENATTPIPNDNIKQADYPLAANEEVTHVLDNSAGQQLAFVGEYQEVGKTSTLAPIYSLPILTKVLYRNQSEEAWQSQAIAPLGEHPQRYISLNSVTQVRNTYVLSARVYSSVPRYENAMLFSPLVLESFNGFDWLPIDGFPLTNTLKTLLYHGDYPDSPLYALMDDGNQRDQVWQLDCLSDSLWGGDVITSDLFLHAFANTETGVHRAQWRLGGEDTTPRGDKVMWGYYYVSPEDVSWGNADNPEVFVKIWFDIDGRIDVNYAFVSVPDFYVFSTYNQHPVGGERNNAVPQPDAASTLSLNQRYVNHSFQPGYTNAYNNDAPLIVRNIYDESPVGRQAPQKDVSFLQEVSDGLKIGGLFKRTEVGNLNAQWYEGGRANTARGDFVIWGHLYADPADIGWGSPQNPDAFVKIWFDNSGRIDVNAFHVSVPELQIDATYDSSSQQDFIHMNERYLQHQFSQK